MALWLFVVNPGIAFGAGSYEHRIVVSGWIRSSPESGRHWNADRAFTFSYFIPTMVGLMRAADAPELAAVATLWANLNYLRHAIVLAAWLAALKTLALFHQLRG
jgi:hypothetical protein